MGRRIVCSLPVGVYEGTRTDSNSIPKRLLGNPIIGRFQTSYLNYDGFISSGLAAVMTNRID